MDNLVASAPATLESLKEKIYRKKIQKWETKAEDLKLKRDKTVKDFRISILDPKQTKTIGEVFSK